MAPFVPPLAVPWTMKPVSSATSGLDVRDDGRLHLWIRHDVIQNVTPAMLVWWFQHMEGDMELEGARVPRYRVWHPLDHVRFRYVRRGPDPIGPGAVFGIHEVLGRNPAWTVDVRSLVTRLDEGGFAHRPRPHGLPVVRMDYTFARVPGGTRYENSLTFGLEAGPLARPLVRRLNTALRERAFSDDQGRAWIRHNVEEVGNFEFFLPALYAKEARGSQPESARA